MSHNYHKCVLYSVVWHLWFSGIKLHLFAMKGKFRTVSVKHNIMQICKRLLAVRDCSWNKY
jgi:hypothetical protein